MKNGSYCYRVNSRLTDKVIQLHNNGFEVDFSLLNKATLVCLQDNRCFYNQQACVRLIDQVFDFISHSYKYIHTVETSCGTKGLLIIEGIYTCEPAWRYTPANAGILRLQTA